MALQTPHIKQVSIWHSENQNCVIIFPPVLDTQYFQILFSKSLFNWTFEKYTIELQHVISNNVISLTS